jgi:hypothetical protein
MTVRETLTDRESLVWLDRETLRSEKVNVV